MIRSSLIFIAVSSLLAMLLSVFNGALTPEISMFSFLISLTAVKYLYEKEKSESLSLAKKIFYSFVFVIGSLQFAYLLFDKNSTDVSIYTLNPNNLGDLPFHINMIRAFSKGLSFWPENPILSFETLKYPFGMNLFNAQFEILLVHLKTHLFFVGIFCLGLSILSLNRLMGAWGVCAFFFSGGFGSLSALFVGHAWHAESTIAWKNLFLAVFVPQRGLLYALPAGVYLLSEFSKNTELTKKHKISLGVIWGALGFFHLHTFFILTLLIGVLLLVNKTLLKTRTAWLTAAVIGLPFVLVSLAPSENWVSPVRWAWGWMLNKDENFIFFLLKNFGAWLALLPVLVWLIVKKKKDAGLIISGLFLFAFFFNLILAPWAWDQIKILMWCYLFLNWIVYQKILKTLPLKLKVIAALIVFYPGLIQFYKSMPAFSYSQAVSLFKRTEIRSMRTVMANVNPNERVFIAPRYDHPIFYLGHSVVMGYPGHIWSHGYSPGRMEEKIKSVLINKGDLSRFKELGATWILSSHYEIEDFGLSYLIEDSAQGRDSAWNLVKVPDSQSK